MIEDTALLSRIRDDFKDARKHSSSWRAESVESYKFIAGGRGQWNSEDVQTLEDNERPVISFNRIGPYIDAISGNEINSRHTIKYLPRTLGDTKVNEVYTAAIKWVRDNCNAEDEESDAFVDVLACGMGWVETAMEYDVDPDGKVVMNRTDPGQMFWDPSAKKRNLEDRRWNSRSEWMAKDEIEEKWPDAEVIPGSATWTEDPEESGSEPHNATFAFLYRRDQTGFDERTKKYRVVHYQWWEHETVWRAVDPSSGNIATFTETRWKAVQKAVPGIKGVKQKRRTYYQAFVQGDTVLEKTVLKCKGFTFKCITGKRNKVENTWYGLVENMKDPQRWANKFFSQILHIINSNAKGGLMAETGAFVDPKKAEEAWADPNAVILLKNGGLAKVKERTSANYPQGLDKLMTFAINSMPAVAGINLETLGLVDRDQAGILEQERKKSTFTILAPFFDSLRRYRKEQGRLLFHFVNEYISDGRLIRIENDQGQQWVPLNRQDSTLEYDIIVDESPTSPNQKQEVWQTMSALIPPLLKAGMPLPPDFFDYSPLPSELAAKMKASMQKKLPPQVEEMVKKMQAELQALQQENQQLKTDHSLEAAKLQSKDGQAKLKADVSMEQSRMDYAARIQEMEKKHETAITKLIADSHEQFKTMQHEMQLALVNARAEAFQQSAQHHHEKTVQARDMGGDMLRRGDERITAIEQMKLEHKHALEQQKTEISAAAKGDSEALLGAISGLAESVQKMKDSINSITPVAAKKIRSNGEMVAADISYKSGETRRVTIN